MNTPKGKKEQLSELWADCTGFEPRPDDSQPGMLTNIPPRRESNVGDGKKISNSKVRKIRRE